MIDEMIHGIVFKLFPKCISMVSSCLQAVSMVYSTHYSLMQTTIRSTVFMRRSNSHRRKTNIFITPSHRSVQPAMYYDIHKTAKSVELYASESTAIVRDCVGTYNGCVGELQATSQCY